MTTPINHKLTPQVQQWLHRVIAPEYTDPQRAYNDVATALFNTPSLSPRTEVYTHEDGRPELLLHLHGTIPVLFRGASYNIPLTIWLPHTYPRQPPMAFVTPAKDMLIRPGNHVDPSGRCYHPYLANWINYSDRSNIVDLCDVLRGVFGREPPVYSKTAPPVVMPAEATPPPLPPLPEELAGRVGGSSTPTPASVGTPVGPPPLPPLPREMRGGLPSPGAGGRFPGHQSPPSLPLPPAPPVPPHPNAQHQQQQRPLQPGENTNGQGRGAPGGYIGGGPPPRPLPPVSHRASGTPQLQAPPYNPPGSAVPYPPPSFRQAISAPLLLPPHSPAPHPHHQQRPLQTSPPPPPIQTYRHPPQHYHPPTPFPPHTPQPPPAVKRPDPIDIMSLPPSSPPTPKPDNNPPTPSAKPRNRLPPHQNLHIPPHPRHCLPYQPNNRDPPASDNPARLPNPCPITHDPRAPRPRPPPRPLHPGWRNTQRAHRCC
ncbi:unnamed protein product [Tuber aestivum]|uniref:UEV domain-containing protein n=1 Tax=Tuber aestivum TaxID=59557 RepID=A0A292PRA3_9PEZI|nr:unnamed protein product [Tuber aestivum]